MVIQIKKHSLKENIASLVSLKGLEYLLNFILLPYLVRILGVERFGAIAFMQGIVQYFIILVDYGFNMTAPRDLAKANSKKSIAHIFSNIMASKILIGSIITVIAMIVILLIQEYFYFDTLLFVAVFFVVIGNVLFPIWFFQGIQQMRYITLVNVLARLLVVGMVFLLVKGPDDYLLAAFLQAITTVVAGIFSLFILLKQYRFIFCRPSLKIIRITMKNGWHIFVSTIAINIYTTTNLVILGILTDTTIVGYFSAANKIIDSIKGLMNAVTQAVYPRVSQILKENRNKVVEFLHIFFRIYCGISLIGSVLLTLLSWLVVRILFGTGYEETTKILEIMAILPFIISISNVFGIQTMLNFGWQKAFSKILVFAAIFNLIIVVPLAMIWQGEGVALSMIFTESLVTVCSVYYVMKKKRINIVT